MSIIFTLVAAFQRWCRERYEYSIQQPALPSAGQLALKRYLAALK
ncbi:MAG TPA: hypothetical protein VFN80_00350 [Acidothermaceae bacterium]|jgi:hypothetical protein|nr:hypothetical protein [Acidothermaceae bacterium]